MPRNALIGVASLALLLLAAGAFLYFKVVAPGVRIAEAELEAKKAKLQPRIIIGQGDFKKRLFYASDELGRISEVRFGWPADREAADIAVVGSHGVDFIDAAGHVKQTVRFTEARGSFDIVRLDPSGAYGYLTREESWSRAATLLDKEGHEIWHSDGGSWPGIDDSAAGDVDGKGKPSIVVGYNGAGGVALFDLQGNRLWKKLEANVWHVETLDTNGDGRAEILHSNAGGQLVVRNASGDVIGRYLSGVYVSHFAVTLWGDEQQPTHILVPISEAHEGGCNPMFVILEANGKQVARLESPLGDLFSRTKSTPIRFPKASQFFAVIENDFASDRSNLLLYDGGHRVVYQEILGESCLGLAEAGKEVGRLLVGCNGKIWEFSPMQVR